MQQVNELEEEQGKKRTASISIIVLIAIAAFAIIFCVSIIVSRTIYPSELTMKRAVVGTYTYNYGNIQYQINVADDKVIQRCSIGTDTELRIESWNPYIGSIDILLGKIIVTKSGDIKYNRTTYKKGGTWVPIQPMADSYAVNESNSHSTSGYDLIYDATLVYGNGDVIIAVSEDALSSFFDALVGDNEAALQELFNSGLIGETPQGTKVAIVESGIMRYKVKILDGPYEGNTVWVIAESVQKN